MQYKHVSVDFWHTLGEPNRDYGGIRNTVLASYYGVTPEQAGKVYKRLKNQQEAYAIQYGVVVPLPKLHALFNGAMGCLIDSPSFAAMLEELRREFRAHPPAICAESLGALRRLRGSGTRVSVGSNTNFIIRGETIRSLLPDDLFEFQLYSDEVGVCKPNPAFFAYMLLRAGRTYRLNHPREILHVGDSPQCDRDGAEAVGMGAVLLEESYPLRAALEILEGELA